MAKKIKQRADVQEITSGFEELPIINSRPIDVFVAPSRVPTSDAVNQLINSLERFNPALQNYKAEEYKTFTVEEEANAQKEFDKTKKDIKKAVKDGDIPAGASPEFVNAYVKLDLKKKARLFKTQLFEAYREQQILGNSDPEAFNIFFDKFSAEFKTNNKLDGYNPVNVAEGFLPFTMASYEQLNAQHITARVAELEKNTKVNFADEAYNIGYDGRYGDEQTVNNYFLYNDKKIPEKDKRLVFIAENLFDQAQELIDTGFPASEANEIIRDTIKNLALNYEDERLLKIFDYIPTADGANMAGTQSVQNLVNDTKREITQRRMLRITQEEKLTAYDEKQDVEAIIDNMTAFVDERGIHNISPSDFDTWMKAGFKRADGKDIVIDVDRRQQLLTLYQNYQNALDLVDEDRPLITQFYTRITENPYDIEIKKDLIDALGTDINDTTYKSLLAFQQNALAYADSPYIRHDTFTTLVSDLDEMLTEYGEGTIDKATSIQGIRALREYGFTYLNENPKATKEMFDNAMAKKADQILLSGLKKAKIDKIIVKRDAFGMENTLLQELKKINNEFSYEDKSKILFIMEKQSELHKQFFNLETLSSDDYKEQMNELNNQILEITTKYNDTN